MCIFGKQLLIGSILLSDISIVKSLPAITALRSPLEVTSVSKNVNKLWYLTSIFLQDDHSLTDQNHQIFNKVTT